MAEKKNWSEAIAKQLGVPSVDVLSTFASRQWRVVYVDTHQADEVFLFYPNVPAEGTYINMWSGAAMRSEGAAMEEWALKNVPGIPKQLASCFAWYATAGR
ncbi:hypothetical protein [Pseudoduganella violaceinigra]|uniref:hypothetical protein n=1 Tax=Pseudoduganella violaceinigra TaxID=246602 RepID=UPI0005546FF9|nr:hypothetical protein [Pseudoduganella violaceinigra]